MNNTKKKIARATASRGEMNPKKKRDWKDCRKFNHGTKNCIILQCRVMPEVEVDCGETSEMEPNLKKSTEVLSGEEEMDKNTTNQSVTEERYHEDGMQAVL